ncbi:adhesion G-protein coupled receptor G5 isoform X2 [Choloepus didactylus]|uniref:adhesion G-protein coupled receptor G5 isoform X2 n=1 Tax=Choloepus didactylus TaxID=27675 RepID=UPI00189E7E52|nr:adhesion G-protein coupled receptor G5 isoform X2 [Choloepus didactylus]
MDRWEALLLCLCLVTSQSGAAEATQELRSWMEKMEMVPKGRILSHLAQYIRQLEWRLLNTSFTGCNLTVQTRSIQSLAFKLGCDFSGLFLSSSTLEPIPGTPARHAMQFPAELTRGTCQTNPRELRLICVYFSTSFFFQDGYTVTCVFWKEGASKLSWGAWSPEGCRTEQPSPAQVLCRCSHLSYFAVLMQLSQAPIPAELLTPLTYISLVGCSISIVASLLTILLHFHARKQSNSITCIHVHLHTSVLLLNVAFLLSPLPAMPSLPGPECTVLAATLHYALLSCLTWMAIEGFNLYLLLGRVYNIYIHRYVLKLCMLGWGFPALLVLTVIAVKSSVYGPHVIPVSVSQENGMSFQNVSICWVRSPAVRSFLVVGYCGLTSLFNLVVLAWTLQVLRRLRAQEQAQGARACRDTVTVLGLTVLLGTTWALAFFSFGVFLLPQLFLFTIFNSLYGRAWGHPGGPPGGSGTAGRMFTARVFQAQGVGKGSEIQPMALLARQVWGPVCSEEGNLPIVTKAPYGLAVATCSSSYALPLLTSNPKGFWELLMGPREAQFPPSQEVPGPG